jgi:methylenetetrahydrofolate dehydrogenase (NADP+) / methenyltetrahydrofolate cyclohydrolase
MSARIIDGRVVARETLKKIRKEVEGLERAPGLAVIRVGEDPASQVYVRRKSERAEKLGFHQRTTVLPEETSESALLEVVRQNNADPLIDGILVQLPLPKHIDSDSILAAIEPTKDVDGFHAVNAGRLFQGRGYLIPCTPKGVMRLLSSLDMELSGANAVVIGRSNIVGRPMAALLEQANCTVTVCHSRTREVEGFLERADIVVAAVGRPNFVQGDWLKPGAIVIDVGINRMEDGTLCGDVHFESAVKVAGAITPVPGGVGPMTIGMLMENTLLSSVRRQG